METPLMWFSVDDKMHGWDRTVDAGLSAVGLWVVAGSWCAANETDGALSRKRAERLGGSRNLAQSLVDALFWQETETGFVMLDWQPGNRTKEQLEAKREETRNRVRNHRSNAVTNGNVLAGQGRGKTLSMIPTQILPDVDPDDVPAYLEGLRTK